MSMGSLREYVASHTEDDREDEFYMSETFIWRVQEYIGGTGGLDHPDDEKFLEENGMSKEDFREDLTGRVTDTIVITESEMSQILSLEAGDDDENHLWLETILENGAVFHLCITKQEDGSLLFEDALEPPDGGNMSWEDCGTLFGEHCFEEGDTEYSIEVVDEDYAKYHKRRIYGIAYSGLLRAIEACSKQVSVIPDVWTDGDKILTKNKATHDAMVSTLESLGFGDQLITGYYDPEEDERDDSVDDHTGCYYITVD